MDPRKPRHPIELTVGKTSAGIGKATINWRNAGVIVVKPERLSCPVPKSREERRVLWGRLRRELLAADLDPSLYEEEDDAVVEALTLAQVALGELDTAARANLPSTQKTELIARVRAARLALSVVSTEGTEERGRLRLLKEAIAYVESRDARRDPKRERLHGAALTKARREGFVKFVVASLGNVVVREPVVDRALRAVLEKARARERWDALNELAKMLGCGSATPESFRTRYARQKV